MICTHGDTHDPTANRLWEVQTTPNAEGFAPTHKMILPSFNAFRRRGAVICTLGDAQILVFFFFSSCDPEQSSAPTPNQVWWTSKPARIESFYTFVNDSTKLQRFLTMGCSDLHARGHTVLASFCCFFVGENPSVFKRCFWPAISHTQSRTLGDAYKGLLSLKKQLKRNT